MARKKNTTGIAIGATMITLARVEPTPNEPGRIVMSIVLSLDDAKAIVDLLKDRDTK